MPDASISGGRVPIVMLIYFDEATIKQTLEGLMPLKDRIALILVENASPNSGPIRNLVCQFASRGLVADYIHFHENISNNAIEIALTEVVDCRAWPHIVVTDGDLLATDGNAWLEEELAVLTRSPEVFAISSSLDMDNLPLATFPSAGGWIPADLSSQDGYIEARTGIHFTMFRGPELADALEHFKKEHEPFRDDVLQAYCYGMLGRRWARTRAARVRHLTWDMYADLNHPYTKLKLALSHAEHWDHRRRSSFERPLATVKA